MGGRLGARAALLVLVVGALQALPTASAHCDFPRTIVVVQTCDVHGPLEEFVVLMNSLQDGNTAYVLAKDFRWHPETVTIRSGGTVVWLYADVHQAQQHDPRSSSSCGSQDLDLAKCVPLNAGLWGQCFDVLTDAGKLLVQVGDHYPVSFRYDATAGTIQKRYGTTGGGWLEGVPGPYVNCPANTSSNTAERAVIPYHCGIHGTPFTFEKNMRGAIIVES